MDTGCVFSGSLCPKLLCQLSLFHSRHGVISPNCNLVLSMYSLLFTPSGKINGLEQLRFYAFQSVS